MLGEGGEGGFGFPRHVGVGVSVAVVEELDDAVACQVQVVAGVAARSVRVAVKCEEEHDRAVDVATTYKAGTRATYTVHWAAQVE